MSKPMSLKITGGETTPYFSGFVSGIEVCNLLGTLENNGQKQEVKITRSWFVEDAKTGADLSRKTENKIFNGGCEVDFSEAKIDGFDNLAPNAAESFFRMVAQEYSRRR